MNDTEIKTRLGYILQGIVRIALERAGITFAENFQYDPACQEPDFLIPDSVNPEFVVEVHQTDSRDSFRMKTLRAFTAVTEAKAFYGDSLASVNIVFGDPNVELPPSNIRALFGFFDINLVPRYDALNIASVVSLEDSALQLASDEDWSVIDSVSHLSSTESDGIDVISQLLQNALNDPSINAFIHPLWELERERVSAIGNSPEVGDETYYKRNILRSLYFSDEHFAELVDNPTPSACTSRCSEEVKQQLILTRLAEGQPAIIGARILSLDEQFSAFLKDPDAGYLREICKAKLDENQRMYYFFEDIRNTERRQRMSEIFLNLATGTEDAFLEAVKECFHNGDYEDIRHTRCWLADLMPLVVDESHNAFNRRMYQHTTYTQNLGNPFNNITIRSPRLGKNEEALKEYIELAVTCFHEFRDIKSIDISQINVIDLTNKLAAFRFGAAIKLQQLNPLYIFLESVAERLELTAHYQGVKSLLSDLSRSSDAVGKYDMYRISNGAKTALVNLIAVHDNHGDDKSKEWGARRLSTLYRFIKGEIQESGYDDGIFVIDGEWEQKDVNRLHRCGWNYVVRLSNLETALREVFNLA